jgi:hypothetical protein
MLRLASTLTVLERAAGSQYISDRAEMRAIYERLRRGDDGLPPIDRTRLLQPDLWAGHSSLVSTPEP